MGGFAFVGAPDESKKQSEIKDLRGVKLAKPDPNIEGPSSVIAEVVRKRDHDTSSLVYRTRISELRQDPKARNHGNSMIFAGQNSAALLKSEALSPTLMTMSASTLFTMAFHEVDGPTVLAEFKKSSGNYPLFSFVDSDASSVTISAPGKQRPERIDNWIAAQSLYDSMLMLQDPCSGMKLYRIAGGGRNEISISKLEQAENVRHSADLNDQKEFNRLMLLNLPVVDAISAPASAEGYVINTDKYLIVTDANGFALTVSDLANKSYLSSLSNKTFMMFNASSEKANYSDDFPTGLDGIVMRALGDGDEERPLLQRSAWRPRR